MLWFSLVGTLCVLRLLWIFAFLCSLYNTECNFQPSDIAALVPYRTQGPQSSFIWRLEAVVMAAKVDQVDNCTITSAEVKDIHKMQSVLMWVTRSYRSIGRDWNMDALHLCRSYGCRLRCRNGGSFNSTQKSSLVEARAADVMPLVWLSHMRYRNSFYPSRASSRVLVECYYGQPRSITWLCNMQGRLGVLSSATCIWLFVFASSHLRSAFSAHRIIWRLCYTISISALCTFCTSGLGVVIS